MLRWAAAVTLSCRTLPREMPASELARSSRSAVPVRTSWHGQLQRGAGTTSPYVEAGLAAAVISPSNDISVGTGDPT